VSALQRGAGQGRRPGVPWTTTPNRLGAVLFPRAKAGTGDVKPQGFPSAAGRRGGWRKQGDLDRLALWRGPGGAG